MMTLISKQRRTKTRSMPSNITVLFFITASIYSSYLLLLAEKAIHARAMTDHNDAFAAWIKTNSSTQKQQQQQQQQEEGKQLEEEDTTRQLYQSYPIDIKNGNTSKFIIPNDKWLNWNPKNTKGRFKWGMPEAFYLRSKEEWNTPPKKECASSLEVLAWLMDKINSQKETLMLFYGELIHILREKEFVDSDGRYLDDDFDAWVTASTYQLIVDELEPMLWERLGWSLRVFYSYNKSAVPFGQILPHCGHNYFPMADKAMQKFPAIELYVTQAIEGRRARTIVRDNWMGISFFQNWIFPTQIVSFTSLGFNGTLNLQIPAEPDKVLTCLYGNWTQKSRGHAYPGKSCVRERKTKVKR